MTMSGHMTSYYLAEQLNVERRATQAAQSWNRRGGLHPSGAPRDWTWTWTTELVVLVAVVGCLLGLWGAVEARADNVPAVPDIVVTEHEAGSSGESIPT